MASADRLAHQLLDPKVSLNVDGLLDAIIALYNDCNFPMLKRIRNIETFMTRNQEAISELQEKRMKETDFDLIKVIGRGAFGEVRLVRHIASTKVYAMKALDKNEMIRRADSAFFWEERDIMAHSKSEWLVRLHYAFQDVSSLFMVMEFMPGGDLVYLMSRFEITEQWAQFYVAELVLALDVIHSLGYIHRDVKPDNMLVSAEGHIKLADFGTCVKMGPDGFVRCSTAVGTPDYISPEMLKSQGNEGVYGREVDWWSVGILLYEMIFGDTPFYSDSLMATYARIMNHSKELAFPNDVEISSAAKDLIQKLLSESKNRLGRKGSSEVMNHDFFKNDQWTFATIKDAEPPYRPELNGDDDTSHFEDPGSATNPAESFPIPKAFTGTQLPFIGFTFSNDVGPIPALKNNQQPAAPAPPKEVVVIKEVIKEVKEPAKDTSKLESDLELISKRADRLKAELDAVYEQKIATENELQSKIRDLQNRIENVQLSQNEVERLRGEKTLLESEVNELGGTRKTLEARLNDIQDQLKIEQSICKAFKSELQTREDGLNAAVTRRQNVLHENDVLRRELDILRDQLNSEQIARRVAEQNLDTSDTQTRSLQATLASTVDRYTRERDKKDQRIEFLTQRETALMEENRKLEEQMAQLEEALKKKETLLQQQQQQQHHHHESPKNPSTSGSINGDLDNLSREQLIQRVQREMLLKDQAIQKLVFIGSAKGIGTDAVSTPNKNNKKSAKNDAKRIREQVELEMKLERDRYREALLKQQEELDYTRNIVHEQDEKIRDLTADLNDLRAIHEDLRHRDHSDYDAHSLDARSQNSMSEHVRDIATRFKFLGRRRSRNQRRPERSRHAAAPVAR